MIRLKFTSSLHDAVSSNIILSPLSSSSPHPHLLTSFGNLWDAKYELASSIDANSECLGSLELAVSLLLSSSKLSKLNFASASKC